MSGCPHCGGPLVLLGVLGHLTHLRCRDCGAQVERETEPDCGTCEGSGETPVRAQNEPGVWLVVGVEPCPDCDGAGS